MNRAIYDYKGEQFGYLDGLRLFDLDGNLFGEMRISAIYGINGDKLWNVDRDGLYDMHWVHIGYLGEPRQDNIELD